MPLASSLAQNLPRLSDQCAPGDVIASNTTWTTNHTVTRTTSTTALWTVLAEPQLQPVRTTIRCGVCNFNGTTGTQIASTGTMLLGLALNPNTDGNASLSAMCASSSHTEEPPLTTLLVDASAQLAVEQAFTRSMLVGGGSGRLDIVSFYDHAPAWPVLQYTFVFIISALAACFILTVIVSFVRHRSVALRQAKENFLRDGILERPLVIGKIEMNAAVNDDDDDDDY